MFSNFFYIFENPIYRKIFSVVFANRLDLLPGNFFSVISHLFAEPYPNFMNFDRFSEKKKTKIRKKSEKFLLYSYLLKNSATIQLN